MVFLSSLSLFWKLLMTTRFRPLLIALFIFYALLPAHAAVHAVDQPSPYTQPKSPFGDLARLEFDPFQSLFLSTDLAGFNV